METILPHPPVDGYVKMKVPNVPGEALVPTSGLALVSKFVTILSAEEAAALNSAPPALNIPPGKYIFVGGIIEYSAEATTDLEFGSADIIIADDNGFVISKFPTFGSMSPGESVQLSHYDSAPVASPSGLYRLSTDGDSATAPDGELKVTVLLHQI